MTRFQALCGTAIATLLCASPALADLTALQVWEEWKSFGESFGQEITGTESVDGNVLSVSDVQILMDFDEGTILGTLDSLTFTEQGDGSVAIGFPEVYPAKIELNPKLGDDVVMNLMTRQSGMQIIATGTPEETNYDFAADSMSISVGDFQAEGVPVDMKMDVSMAQLAGAYQLMAGDISKIIGGMTVASTVSEMHMVDPENGAKADWTAKMDDLRLTLDYDLPKELDPTNLSAMMQAGLKAVASYEIGPMSYEMAITESGQSMQIQGTATAGALNVALDDSLRYGGTQTGLNLAFSGSNIPFPQVSFAAEETTFDLEVPMGKSETPEDFGFLTRLKGLSISEQIWSMFDPTGALPRDPADLTIDLSGKANWLVDVFDPAVAEQMPMAMAKPGELHALTVNDLLLKLMGAELTGAGAFTFDNTDTTTFDGMPKPEGTLNLQLIGANGLMDKLTQLGLLPQEQAMGARMMLGLFARPGDGPDSLVSEITVTEDGAVMANGQRLR